VNPLGQRRCVLGALSPGARPLQRELLEEWHLPTLGPAGRPRGSRSSHACSRAAHRVTYMIYLTN
jgi:hypothetical protein